ncbi:hypothetical protein JDV02_003237 [Purpureocillium takamizusanense]|uniref:Uncharacterized protein n=1 Tax=Purpureocillium takamizusanense TaxID=2060973 RepID=A0A9Q8QCT8_9HYPO|nr:uncharacterized protein JDV02_003237 [Purpureocillium takamizusanense]UNI16841.1 hypothetical protein JDV02_003237 [Purpureocillium takamizusanense]
MGLLSFLTSRRNAGGADRSREATSSTNHQPYHTTVAAHPPVRGTRAVYGNGPVSLENLQRQAARKRPSQPQLSTGIVKPFFLGVVDERPSSAPGDEADVWRSRSPGAIPRFPVLETYHSNVSRGRSLVRKDRGKHSLTPSIATSNRTALATLSGVDSATGAGSSRRAVRHVDLLDAQGEIKPADFKSRVRAAGARDYGEDVADRNLGENGVDLATPAVQRFYASLEQTATKTPYERRATMITLPTLRRAEATMLNIARADEQDQSFKPYKRRSLHGLRSGAEMEEQRNTSRRTESASQRTRSLDARTLLTLPKSTSKQKPSPERNLRHALGSIDANSMARSSTPKGKERSMSPAHHAPGSTPRGWITAERRHPDRSRASQRHQRWDELLSVQAFESSGQSSRAASPPAVPRYRPMSAMGITSDNGKAPATPSNTSTPRRRQRREGGYLDERAYTPVAAAHREMRIYDSQLLYAGLSYEPRGRDEPGEQQTAMSLMMRGNSSDNGGSLSDCAPAPSVSTCRRKASRSRSRPKRGSHAQWKSPWISLAAPEAGGPSEPSAGPSSHHGRNRSWSCLAAPERGGASISDFVGYVPPRNSSLRHWSISSLTPTTELSDGCSTSTYLFASPQSNHTANTSLDMPLSVKQPPSSGVELKSLSAAGSTAAHMLPGSALYVPSLEDDAFTETTLGSRNGSRTGFFDVSHAAGKADSLDLEAHECDCADGSNSAAESDSDVDSFVEKRRVKVKDDEALLFKEEGYGKAGTNLPGLFDPEPESKPCLMCSLLHCAAIDPPLLVDGPAMPLPCGHKEGITQRDRLRALGYEYDTEESASEPDEPPEPESRQQGRGRGRSVTEKPTVGSPSPQQLRDSSLKAASRQAQEAKHSHGRRLKRSRGVIEPVLEGCEGHDGNVVF